MVHNSSASASNCRRMRARDAPSVKRSAISLRRSAARAENRLVTFTHAINSTHAAPAKSARSAPLTSPYASSCSPASFNCIPRFAACGKSRCISAEMRSRSACASRSDTPGFIRATSRRKRPDCRSSPLPKTSNIWTSGGIFASGAKRSSNRAGNTPARTAGPSRVDKPLPKIPRSLRNLRPKMPPVSITAGPPVSVRENVRPATALTPRTSKKFAVTCAHFSCSGSSPASVRGATTQMAAMPLNAVCRLDASTNIGPEMGARAGPVSRNDAQIRTSRSGFSYGSGCSRMP